jgi:tetratricopeptide (TPR) repeat protein
MMAREVREMAAETTRASMVDGDGTRAHTSPTAPPTSILDAGDAPPAPPVADGPAGRYELLEEIDRGGMGAVLRAVDRTLGREVAVKVLQERFAAGSVIARRFVDEARIAGQLQHPGIPPVHDLGTLPDGRPFLAMKLIKGRTLDAMLRDRPDATADRGRFVAAFEQACQAVAYAHSRRVIHRDLKPANVMVGAFGEVQVMDWGLAKVLTDGPESAPTSSGESDERLATEIRSGRDTEGSETQAGSVLGTPAFMAPEQAIGAVDQVDARSDVFGLGAILAVILTGRPPFVGEGAEATRVLAARGKLDDCFALLDACGAEPELVALCKRCLSPERDDRPPDAGAVAQAVAGLRAVAEERARRAELDRVRAEAEARAQRQKRRMQLAVAAGVLGLLTVGGGGWVAVRSQAEARRADAGRVVSVALGRAEQLASQAGAIDAGEVAPANDVVRLWEQAETAVKPAEAAVAGAGDSALAARVEERAAAIRAGLARARRDAKLLAALEVARSTGYEMAGGNQDLRALVRLYREAFAAAGLPADGDAATLAATVRDERPGLREALVRGLNGWNHGLRWPLDPDADRVRAAVDLADSDPIRKEVRAAVATDDRTGLARLAGRLAAAELDPGTAEDLASALNDRGMAADAVRILRAVRDRHPSDPGLQEVLAWTLIQASPDAPVPLEEAVGCARAAIAARPDRAAAHYTLGCIYSLGKHALAVAEPHYLKAVELNPRFTFAMINLGSAREGMGDPAGAERWYRKAAEVDPRFVKAHDNLCGLLMARGDLAGAEVAFRKVLEIQPDSAWSRARLALVRRMAELRPRLDDVVAGRAEPADPAEALAFAALCYQPFRSQYAAATRLSARAFEMDPKIAAIRGQLYTTNSNGYDAACDAALAGCGQGADAPADPPSRAALRRQALGWLRADLARRAEWATSARSADRDAAAGILSHWLSDGDLAGVRPGPGRIELPADERAAWDVLWADVRAAIDRARRPAPAQPPAVKTTTAPSPGG